MSSSRTQETEILSVTQLTAQIKETLEGRFPSVWVCGEISNFARPQSGHCYLTLKDDSAQLRAVIWRTAAGRLPFDPHDGLEVVCQGSLDLYPPRGSYQLVIREMHPKGIGALEMALRQLREKFSREGLFDKQHKRPLPKIPRRIAVLTSPTGAAIRDFLEVLRRRWSDVDVLVVPVRVQGEGASQEIAQAIDQAGRLSPRPDVMVVTRGGGSLEDLWAFNEEPLVRAIHRCEIPVVSAVGHEIDITLCDLVADLRALTPSEAAERVVPDAGEIRIMLRSAAGRLSAALRGRAAAARGRLDAVASRVAFRRPFGRLQYLSQQLDEQQQRIIRAIRRQTTDAARATKSIEAQLETLNPMAVLRRGYSITCREGDGLPIRDAGQLVAGEPITTRFAKGTMVSLVETIDE